MNPREYILATKEISPPRLATVHDRISLYAIGAAGEVGEVCELIKKHLFHDRSLDVEQLVKEVGDVTWYLARLIDAVTEGRLDLGDVMEANIAKLRARHPEGWHSDYQSDRSPS